MQKSQSPLVIWLVLAGDGEDRVLQDVELRAWGTVRGKPRGGALRTTQRVWAARREGGTEAGCLFSCELRDTDIMGTPEASPLLGVA